ncbi:E3 ubiquitin-protein ligase MIB2-like [Branchiostoma floridae x Branchiostoma belcheri]|nr:hypothetical protein Bbelb_247650 [Branchiostoma belcheri]
MASHSEILAQAYNSNVRDYREDTRQIVKFLSAPGQLVHCPFNPAHVVKCCKVEDHYKKCSKDYKGPALATCKYNRLHLVAPRDLDQHQSFCPCAPSDIKLRAAAAANPPVIPGEDLREKLTCKICLVRGLKVAFQCGHMFCQICAAAMATCPACRVVVSRVQPVFFI